MRIILSALVLLLPLAACDDYHPGRTNNRPMLNQNLPANGQPENVNARPR